MLLTTTSTSVLPTAALVPILRAAAGVASTWASQPPAAAPSATPPTASPPTAAAPTGGLAAALRGRAGIIGSAPPTLAAPAGVQVANPDMDPIVARQQRYRIVGDGPVSTRQVLPATATAAVAAAKDGASIAAVRRVLQLVESAAGGPEQSADVTFNGVALADSAEGHAANAYRAQLDDNAGLGRELTSGFGFMQRRRAAEFGRDMVRQSEGSLATVVSGWMNVGPETSRTLLAPAAASEGDLAQAVRVLGHEAVHIVDPGNSDLPGPAADMFHEARAEARSMPLPKLQAARAALGFDSAVGDATLAAASTQRPYLAAELLLQQVYAGAGIVPGSAEAAALDQLDNQAALDHIIGRLAARGGQSEAQLRELFAGGFGEVAASVG